MNNTMHTIEDRDEKEMAERIGSIGMSVKPREEALRVALQRRDPGRIPTPYDEQGWLGKMRKTAAVLMIAFLLVGVGDLIIQPHRASVVPLSPAVTTPSDPTDSSDVAIASDVGAIDSQLAALDGDVAAAQTDGTIQ